MMTASVGREGDGAARRAQCGSRGPAGGAAIAPPSVRYRISQDQPEDDDTLVPWTEFEDWLVQVSVMSAIPATPSDLPVFLAS